MDKATMGMYVDDGKAVVDAARMLQKSAAESGLPITLTATLLAMQIAQGERAMSMMCAGGRK